MSLVVTGTGTEVGKTIVCAMILARHARRRRIAYWKPIATGSSESSDTQFIRSVVGKNVEILSEVYSLGPPVSPHLAARLGRRRIEPEQVVGAFVTHAMADDRRNLLIEGIGGLLVPLTDDGYLLASLFEELHLPLLIVASSRLGTINHTLLTLEAARSRRLEIAGVILSGPPNAENRRAIERFGSVDVLAEVPVIPSITHQGITQAARSFDRKGRLKQYFE